MLTVDRFW